MVAPIFMIYQQEKKGEELKKLFQQVMKECGVKEITINERGCFWSQTTSHDTKGFGFWRKLAERVFIKTTRGLA